MTAVPTGLPLGPFDRLRSKWHRLYDTFILRTPPRNANPYATHVPILVLTGRLIEVRRVLELGCGKYSTLLFLNRTYFPHLESLRSLETDASWGDRVAEWVGTQSRLHLSTVGGPMAEAVAGLDLEEYDLVFVDDSTSAAERSTTIGVLAGSRPLHPLVVIHDFEEPLYRRSANGFRHHFRFSALNPNTGLVWNGSQIRPRELRRANQLLRAAAERSTPDDAQAWLRCFARDA